jgi:NAD+ kinase
MIVTDPRNPAAMKLFDALLQRMPNGVAGEDLVVVVGGDGFLLRTVAEHGFGATYLGLNAGHLGFLLNDVNDWDIVVEQLEAHSYETGLFPLLCAEMTRDDGSVVTDRAINDVYLERATSQTTRIQLSIDNHIVVRQLVADGVVFSTALGSTAYTFSAGGPACHPTLRTLVVTPICPHAPRLHPFALPATARARVDVHDGDRRPVRAVADGRAVENVCHVELGYDGSEVRLAYLRGHDFTSRMVRKILHP